MAHEVVTRLGDLSLSQEEPIVNEGEEQYLSIIREILSTADEREDRTGTGTLSVFGRLMRFDLATGFPLLTTKHVSFRTIAEELFWMISGSTDANSLYSKGVKIWNANASRATLDKLGFPNREEGDLGPIYGFQWRHFGATYVDCKTNYQGQGVDQLRKVIEMIKKNPNSRRIVMSSWNAQDVDEMALPPCHVMCQFYVSNGKLSCMMTQRSGDIGLGVPYNIASYALLTCLIAHITGLQRGEFIHTIADTHIYKTHILGLEEQTKRKPRAFPTLSISKRVVDIDDINFQDLVLQDYNPHPAIKLEMTV